MIIAPPFSSRGALKPKSHPKKPKAKARISEFTHKKSLESSPNDLKFSFFITACLTEI
jgi:hypothetical protein